MIVVTKTRCTICFRLRPPSSQNLATVVRNLCIADHNPARLCRGNGEQTNGANIEITTCRCSCVAPTYFCPDAAVELGLDVRAVEHRPNCRHHPSFERC